MEYDYDLARERIDLRGLVNFGITTFDHLGVALLTVFQIVTSDTWFQQLCNLLDVDMPALATVYVLMMIIVGQFFLMNLILAVIIFAFIKSQQEELRGEIEAFEREEQRKN
jgi:voltage-dependent calcium channel L type alpha-1D